MYSVGDKVRLRTYWVSDLGTIINIDENYMEIRWQSDSITDWYRMDNTSIRPFGYNDFVERIKERLEK